MVNYFNENLILTFISVVIFIWTLPWKAYAIWLAVKNRNKKWFIALLILNTLGILEIIYIFKIAGKTKHEVKSDFKRIWKSLG